MNEREPWLDKRGLAEHFGCSVRPIERALADGMPSAVVFGRRKFRVGEVEPWLEAHGHLVRDGCDALAIVAGSTEWGGDADTSRPRTRGASPHAS